VHAELALLPAAPQRPSFVDGTPRCVPLDESRLLLVLAADEVLLPLPSPMHAAQCNAHRGPIATHTAALCDAT